MHSRHLILPLLLATAGACSRPAAEATGEQAATARPRDGGVPLTADQVSALGIRFAPALPAQEVPLGAVPATVAPPPNARVAVAATLPGIITRTFVVEGDSVRRGQALAVVASRDVLSIGASLARVNARAQVTRATDRRMAQLAREGVIAGARADEARAQRMETDAELAEQSRTLALVNGNARSGTYTLVAPIAGRIATASAQTGSPVDVASAPYVIDATERYEVRAQLPERLIGRVTPGMAVELGEGVRGTVTSVGTVVDPATRSAALRARLPAAPGIVAGRAATATLFGPAPQSALRVPGAALVTLGGAPAVFVRTPAGVVPRKVAAMPPAGGIAVILSGLRAGEQVAVRGASELKALAGAS